MKLHRNAKLCRESGSRFGMPPLSWTPRTTPSSVESLFLTQATAFSGRVVILRRVPDTVRVFSELAEGRSEIS